jgi:cation:H+ antiporter
MLALVALAVAGLALLTVAADQLVVGAGRLAARLGVSPVVVGVVVIGLGTSAPEFVVSGLAAAHGDTGLAVANLVGSNVINVTLILGVAALVAPVVVRSSVPRREAPLSVAAVTAFAMLALLGLGRPAGAVLAVATVVALVLLVRLARVGTLDPMPAEIDQFLADPALTDEASAAKSVVTQPEPGATAPVAHLGREAIRAVLGLAGTLLGAQLLVSSAATAAQRLGVPQTVVGFTLVALGTSLPELVTAVQAQRRRNTDLLVGNILGSNLFNSLTGGAIIGLAGRGIPARIGYPVLAAMVAVMLLTWLVLYRRYRISRIEATLLLVAYLLTLPLIIS